MTYFKRDFSIFEKMNFERAPVGVKYLLYEPQGINKLELLFLSIKARLNAYRQQCSL